MNEFETRVLVTIEIMFPILCTGVYHLLIMLINVFHKFS